MRGEKTKLTLLELRLRDPLSDLTRKERRNLLVASVVGLLLVYSGLAPSKISALGVDFTISEQQALFRVAAGTIAYFFAAFVVYAISDYLTLRAAMSEAMRDRYVERQKLEKLMMPGRARHTSEAERKEEAVLVGEFERAMSNSSAYLMAPRLTAPMQFLRLLVDFGIPMFVGFWAIMTTASHRPTLPTKADVNPPALIAAPASLSPGAGK